MSLSAVVCCCYLQMVSRSRAAVTRATKYFVLDDPTLSTHSFESLLSKGNGSPLTNGPKRKSAQKNGTLLRSNLCK